MPMRSISHRCRRGARHGCDLPLPDLPAAHGRAVHLQRVFSEVQGSARRRSSNLYAGLSGRTQTAQPLLPDLRLDGRLDTRPASQSVRYCGRMLQRAEFSPSRCISLGGRDVCVGVAASRHSALSAFSAGSERQLERDDSSPLVIPLIRLSFSKNRFPPRIKSEGRLCARRGNRSKPPASPCA